MAPIASPVGGGGLAPPTCDGGEDADFEPMSAQPVTGIVTRGFNYGQTLGLLQRIRSSIGNTSFQGIRPL